MALTLQFSTTAQYFKIKKVGLAFADSRRFLGDLISQKILVNNSTRVLECDNYRVREIFSCTEKELERKKMDKSDVQGMSLALLQALLFAGLKDFYYNKGV